MSNETKVRVYRDDCLCLEEGPVEFLKFFEEKIALIPDEYKDVAIVSLDSYAEWDCPYTDFEIYYIRPESEEDRQERKREEEEQEAEREKRELANIELMRKKHPHLFKQ